MSKVNWEKTFHQIPSIMNGMPFRWFIGFGTLLHSTRWYMAQAAGKEYKYPKHDDLDLCVFYDEFDQRFIEQSMLIHGFCIKKRIIDNRTKKPLYLTIKTVPDTRETFGDLEICIFCLYEHKGFYWHTYDMRQEKKEVPSIYTFKGIEKWRLDGVIKRAMPFSFIEGNFPKNYGSVLDIWYPDWVEQRPHLSTTRWKIDMKSCKSFEKEDYTPVIERCPVFKTQWLMGEKV